MAKKVIALITTLALVFSMTACGSITPNAYDYDLSEYVKLGDYIGVEVEKVEPAEVTEEAITSELTNRLEQNTKLEEVKDGVVADGMTVNIDYEGKVDGKTFEGGSAEGYDLVIGSGSFIEGFESGLVGKKKGETVTLDLKFPDPYEQNADLAGKAVQFTVKINKCSKEVVPELNDEFVKSVSDCKNVDEYKALVKSDLEEQAEETARQQMMSAAWSTVFGNAEILKYPEEEIAAKKKEMNDYYEQYAESYNMTVDQFLEMAGMTTEDFEKETKNYAETTVGEEMVMYAITRAENIKLSEKEYKEGTEKYMKDLDFESVEELEKTYTKDTIVASLLWEKFFNFLLDKAKIVEPKADDTAEDAAKADDTAEDAAKADDTAKDAEKADDTAQDAAAKADDTAQDAAAKADDTAKDTAKDAAKTDDKAKTEEQAK